METKTNEINQIEIKCKISTFGCINCLWNGIECRKGSLYEREIRGNIESCKNYTYYD